MIIHEEKAQELLVKFKTKKATLLFIDNLINVLNIMFEEYGEQGSYFTSHFYNEVKIEIENL